ncbi:SIR2 family protein [bacterium]|nr:SIR2 family protein [bacterium]
MADKSKPVRLSDADQLREKVQELNAFYKAGNLSLLVGAGVSKGSGLPGWSDLNLSLLEGYLRSRPDAQRYSASGIKQLAQDLYAALGRDATADFASEDQTAFLGLLRESLYGGRAVETFPVRSIQRQIAAMAIGLKDDGFRTEDPFVYTTNFDPLIEMAIERAVTGTGRSSDRWRDYRLPLAKSQRKKSPGLLGVQHLHGWVDPPGTGGGRPSVGGTLVITETHYMELLRQQSAEPNRQAEDLLGGERAILIVGMSLLDPNIRRLLYRRRVDRLRTGGDDVYLVLREKDTALDRHLVEYWNSWKITALIVDEFDEIPFLLRNVQWGDMEHSPWISRSVEWLDDQLGDSEVFSDEWQRKACWILRELVDYIYTYFGLPYEETVNTALYLPIDQPEDGPAVIRQVANSRELRWGRDARRFAESRTLIVDFDHEQGMAGRSFLLGYATGVVNDGEGINLRFTDDMLKAWQYGDSPRDWRSILTVPVLDSKMWLPVAVISLTSNLPTPFWERFSPATEDERAKLRASMRRAAKRIISTDLEVPLELFEGELGEEDETHEA